MTRDCRTCAHNELDDDGYNACTIYGGGAVAAWSAAQPGIIFDDDTGLPVNAATDCPGYAPQPAPHAAELAALRARNATLEAHLWAVADAAAAFAARMHPNSGADLDRAIAAATAALGGDK